MTVRDIERKFLGKNFIIEDNLGKVIFDSSTGTYTEFRELSGKEVRVFGIHNTKPNTIIGYI